MLPGWDGGAPAVGAQPLSQALPARALRGADPHPRLGPPPQSPAGVPGTPPPVALCSAFNSAGQRGRTGTSPETPCPAQGVPESGGGAGQETACHRTWEGSPPLGIGYLPLKTGALISIDKHLQVKPTDRCLHHPLSAARGKVSTILVFPLQVKKPNLGPSHLPWVTSPEEAEPELTPRSV